VAMEKLSDERESRPEKPLERKEMEAIPE
jgi:hypothetical protein